MECLIDHIVIDVRDRIAEGAAAFRRLGFQLTPMGKHSLGSANHLAVLGRDYLELLGTDVPGGALRPDLAPFPAGLNGLVFLGQDSEALSAEQQSRGVPVQPALSFFRPADLPDGSRADAKFKVVRLDRAAAFDGRVYWCEHLTPEHVWRPEWQVHANGATGVARILLSVRDPERQAALFRRMFGAAAVTEGADGRAILRAGAAVVEAAPHAAVAAELGAAAPDPAGRGDHMAVLGLRVASPAATAAALSANGVTLLAPSPGLLRVPAAQAMNTTIDFMG
ncbi:VOC family protein [Paeniroseomonas aquatica]|uniref:VOC family protein n=1 Tax=Paeniroseomonas aquatica TaxID=373043 RepID=A0ABT8A295_9PROT|nr:VOC family protein [Paeniroseomonas aquatica]MDN3563850.1 VOC family protein [Paeniroseomonas aquatica]